MYVYIHAYVGVRMYIFKYVCIYLLTYMYIYIYIHVYLFIHTQSMCMHDSPQRHPICISIYTQANRYIHMHRYEYRMVAMEGYGAWPDRGS